MADMEKLNVEELEQVAGGNDGMTQATWKTVKVTGTTYYLALRSRPEYDYKNEIGRLVNGTVIQIRTDIRSNVYVWAYSSTLRSEGWVNGDYVE